MSKRPINQGLLTRKAATSPPQCTVTDILKGENRPLLSGSGDSNPTAILFWSTWCEYSKKFLGWFVKYAKAFHSEVRGNFKVLFLPFLHPFHHDHSVHAICLEPFLIYICQSFLLCPENYRIFSLDPWSLKKGFLGCSLY